MTLAVCIFTVVALLLFPGTFYMYIVSCYILSAQIGFRLPWGVSYVAAGILAVVYVVLVARAGCERDGDDYMMDYGEKKIIKDGGKRL